MASTPSYSKEELVKIYSNSGGPAFGKAYDYIASLVPEKLWIDNLLYSHMPCYYDAVNERFFYIQMIVDKSKLLTMEEIIHYREEKPGFKMGEIFIICANHRSF